MNKALKYILSIVALAGFSVSAMAQDESVDMADTMMTNGKIYVVVAVMLILFAVLAMYLILTDRKMKKLEKRLESLDRK